MASNTLFLCFTLLIFSLSLLLPPTSGRDRFVLPNPTPPPSPPTSGHNNGDRFILPDPTPPPSPPNQTPPSRFILPNPTPPSPSTLTPPSPSTTTPPSPPTSGHRIANRCNYDAIYNFGDGISDTGNLIREGPNKNLEDDSYDRFSHFPYGQSINEAPGRASNGLLMIDFLTNKVGLPMLDPYLNKKASFEGGVNFAVAGATAVDTNHLLDEEINAPITNSSLMVQLDWFKDHLSKTCNDGLDCLNKMKNAIFMVGEIGGRDIYSALVDQGKTIPEAQSLVHEIVDNIKKATQTLIDMGATQLVVPGNFPIGCFPAYMNAFGRDKTMTRDNNSCIKELNDLAMYQNQHLQTALQQLKENHPNVVILYADYYKAFESVFENASEYGFDEDSKFKACCGKGNRKFNFSPYNMCGKEGVFACSNPDQYISWDGIYPTQATYQLMAGWLIKNLSFFRCTN